MLLPGARPWCPDRPERNPGGRCVEQRQASSESEGHGSHVQLRNLCKGVSSTRHRQLEMNCSPFYPCAEERSLNQRNVCDMFHHSITTYDNIVETKHYSTILLQDDST